jgi:hypothetical protein
MCSVCKRVRVALHPIGRNHSAANLSLCNMLLTEAEAEQKLRHSDVMITRKNHSAHGYAINGKHPE